MQHRIRCRDALKASLQQRDRRQRSGLDQRGEFVDRPVGEIWDAHFCGSVSFL
ncbi:hypothetical protein [Hoeflea sp. BAL378]|uniref:hypothetical protein n=1 Tax=Hoeflea sp. BAL378 TaxID=1547437 RepID=UPI001FCC4900|nr:hypothetical protein [Hoeflea sp. BAL378]